MKDFNINRYKALVKYSMTENRKTYLTAFGISLLVFALFFMLFAHCFAYNFGKVDLTNTNVQGVIDISSLIATYLFFAVMLFVVTQVEVSNRYCIAREGMQYCLLPASYKEKGCAILTQFAIFEFIAPMVFYVAVYSLMSLYYMVYGGVFTFQPLAFTEHIGAMFNVEVLSQHQDMIPLANTIRLFIAMLPVTWALELLYYLVLVTFFRTKSQLKAYGLNVVISNILIWIFMACTTAVGALYTTSEGFHEWVDVTFDDVVTIAHTLDALILLQIPLTILFGWWFFRRLHYKEIR